jgi:hypothetical protein
MMFILHNYTSRCSIIRTHIEDLAFSQIMTLTLRHWLIYDVFFYYNPPFSQITTLTLWHGFIKDVLDDVLNDVSNLNIIHQGKV